MINWMFQILKFFDDKMAIKSRFATLITEKILTIASMTLCGSAD